MTVVPENWSMRIWKMNNNTPSKLKKTLAAGHMAVTSECGPPRGSDPGPITEKADLIRNHVDAINITDNQTSVTRLCSLAACIRIKLMGVEPVLQMVTRDRNRIALQSDILGAASYDIHNILCLSGDHQSFGDCPNGQNVHDLDSIQLIQAVRYMRDEGKFLGGDDIKRPPAMFVGAAANPFADPFHIRALRLAKKVNAGVEFIQTQCIYNLERFEKWMEMVRDLGLTEKVYILAGLTPFKSAGMAKYMKKSCSRHGCARGGRGPHRRGSQRKTGRRGHQHLCRIHRAIERGARNRRLSYYGH